MLNFILGFLLGGWVSLIVYVILCVPDDKPGDRERGLDI